MAEVGQVSDYAGCFTKATWSVDGANGGKTGLCDGRFYLHGARN